MWRKVAVQKYSTFFQLPKNDRNNTGWEAQNSYLGLWTFKLFSRLTFYLDCLTMSLIISLNPTVNVSINPADYFTSDCDHTYYPGYRKTYPNGSTELYPHGLDIFFNDTETGWQKCACIAPFPGDADIAGIGVESHQVNIDCISLTMFRL